MQITITPSGTSLAALNKLSATLRTPAMAVLGKGLEADLRAHFRTRNLQPNRRGWKKTNLWASIRTATAYTSATPTTATVTIQGAEGRILAAKVHGATITPRRGKFLAIPVAEEVYGKLARSRPVPGMFVYRSKDGTPGGLAIIRSGQIVPLYIFLRRVLLKPEQNALPTQATIQTAAERRLTAHLTRTLPKNL